MKHEQGKTMVLEAYTPQSRTPAYPWVGLLLGAGAAILLAYPLVLLINSLHDHFSMGTSFKALKVVVLGFKPSLWPLILLYGLSGGLAGVVLGYIFQRIQENRLRLDNMHHEFELQVTTLRHHYKNLALGIQGFSNRIKRKMTTLEEYFRSCAREECITYGQFYQDFDTLQQSVAILEEASQRLTHTLGQELLFLKALTSDSPAIEPQDLFPFLVHCVQDLLGLRFRDKPLRVDLNGLPLEECRDSLLLPFDPHIMEVILQNVLSNAMKSGNHLQIRVKERNTKIWVEVEDNGAGVNVAELKSQLMSSSQRRDAESTHLGLKVSLHLLEKCQGRLLAQSQPGDGALFIIEIPKQPLRPKASPLKQHKGRKKLPLGNNK